jgi:four helix bundle protein
VVVDLCTPLLERRKTEELADQLLRSGTGLDANYGSAQVARSTDEFVSRMGQVVDDAKESLGWVKLMASSRLFASEHLPWLLKEAEELTRIFMSSYRTARSNNERRKAEQKARTRLKKRARRGDDKR